jgi:hypothetical protein
MSLLIMAAPVLAQDSPKTATLELPNITPFAVPESQPRPKTEAVRLTALTFPVTACQLPGQGEDPKKWRNSLTLYGFLPAYTGTARIHNSRNFKVSASIAKTWDTLKDHGDGAFALHYEGGPAKYKAFVDLNYWKLQYSTRDTVFGQFDFLPSQWMIELGGAVPVKAKSMPEGGYTVEGLAGVRYSRLTLEVDHNTTGAGGSQTQEWADFFAGARARYYKKRLEAGIRLDIGAGGSQWTYNVIPQVGYRFNRTIALGLGWRVIEQQYESGGFKWFVKQNGPHIDFRVEF